MLGGKNPEGQRTDSIEIYNCQEDRWTKASALEDPDTVLRMRKPRSGFAAIMIRDEEAVMVIGGNDSRVQNRVEVLNLRTGGWSKMPKMHMKRDELAACIGPDGKVYAIGGYGGADN